jgi:hypothetical protein
VRVNGPRASDLRQPNRRSHILFGRLSRLLGGVFCGGTVLADESSSLAFHSAQTVQAPAREQVAASIRRSAAEHDEWHEACTALFVYQLTESSRILDYSQTGGQMLTADGLPPPESADRARCSRTESEQLSRVPRKTEEPHAALPPARLTAPSLRLLVRAGREETSRSRMFSIDSRLAVSRIISYQGWMLSGPGFASTG